MLTGVSTVWLPVEDLDRARRFYREVLELEERETDGDWAEVQAGDLVIGLNARESAHDGEGGAVVAFRPEGDIEDVVQQLEQRDVRFVGGITEHPWGRVAAFKDPDGNDLELYEPPS